MSELYALIPDNEMQFLKKLIVLQYPSASLGADGHMSQRTIMSRLSQEGTKRTMTRIPNTHRVQILMQPSLGGMLHHVHHQSHLVTVEKDQVFILSKISEADL